MLATIEGHSSAETSKTTTTADIPGTADIQDFGSTSEVSPACSSYYVGRTRLYSFEVIDETLAAPARKTCEQQIR
jgi:hypothetical protein